MNVKSNTVIIVYYFAKIPSVLLSFVSCPMFKCGSDFNDMHFANTVIPPSIQRLHT